MLFSNNNINNHNEISPLSILILIINIAAREKRDQHFSLINMHFFFFLLCLVVVLLSSYPPYFYIYRLYLLSNHMSLFPCLSSQTSFNLSLSFSILVWFICPCDVMWWRLFTFTFLTQYTHMIDSLTLFLNFYRGFILKVDVL